MADPAPWSFYGRHAELQQLQRVLERRRWFFLQISGRRRIGKTTLIQQALQGAGIARTLYIQIPDSDPAGVVAACNGYLETFGIEARIGSLGELARLIGRLAEAGHVVAIDEFQYFHRKQLFDFCSLLQAEVDQLAARATQVPGGLIVLGSLHAEMTALLENRDAPLFNRTTDTLELGHLDVASILEILRVHADDDPARLLFLWNLFEGVPKFYRDAYEQGVLNAERPEVLRRLFFSSSSPLRNEADNWFLRELRGRYDMVLQYLARKPGCSNADIEAAIAAGVTTSVTTFCARGCRRCSDRSRLRHSGRWRCRSPKPTSVWPRSRAMRWKTWRANSTKNAAERPWVTSRSASASVAIGIAAMSRSIWSRSARTNSASVSAVASAML